jgi:hypothetical protein
MVRSVETLHQIPSKAFEKFSGCAGFSALYIHIEEANMRTAMINIEDRIWFFFS